MRIGLILVTLLCTSHQLDALAQSPHCLQLKQPVARAQALPSNAVEPIACPPQIEPIYYDVDSRLMRASKDLSAGDAILAVPRAYLATSIRGQTITVVHRVGPIAISRQGTVLTDTAPGQAVIIATNDGRPLTFRPPHGADHD